MPPPLHHRVLARLRALPRSATELDALTVAMARMRQLGWYDSSGRGRSPVDPDGNPLPWLTHPAIEWLDSVIGPDDTVFEWGSGASTAWFAQRAKSVVSVEHDQTWIAR